MERLSLPSRQHKRMLRKAKRSGEDQYLALLNIRNTPTQGVDSSPAQRFLGRRTKTTLPTSAELLEFRNAVTRPEAEQLVKLQKRQAKYYNQNIKDLPPLETGDTVRMKPFRLDSDTWKKATVTERLDDRSSRFWRIMEPSIGATVSTCGSPWNPQAPPVAHHPRLHQWPNAHQKLFHRRFPKTCHHHPYGGPSEMWRPQCVSRTMSCTSD